MKAEIETTSPVTFTQRAPTALLADFAAVLWYWSGYTTPVALERLMPMGTVELVIQLRNPKPSGSGMAGTRSESLIIERRATDEILGVHFKAGGAFPFLGCAFGELHNISVTLDQLWGEKKARRLIEVLNEAKTVEQKFQVLERWLLWIADRPLKHHSAVSLALNEFQADPGLYTSAGIASKANLSQRRFIELFRDEVGMTPKLFCRVQRFQDALSTIQHLTDVDWVDLAVSLGYSDQSHFIHDFREFSGLSP